MSRRRVWLGARGHRLYGSAALCGDAQAQTFTTLYDPGAPVNPTSLIAGPNGVLYGAADNGAYERGTVFQLTAPPGPGQAWNMTVIYTLTDSDGASPVTIAFGRGGAIFGTTSLGGPANAGTVFELTPPATTGGTWTSQILYSFGGSPDGASPAGSLAFGPNSEQSTVRPCARRGFRLQWRTGNGVQVDAGRRGIGTWTETILHTFTGGSDGVHPTEA